MIYDIGNKSDLLTGTSLTVRIPWDDLDKKALYTIQDYKPEFILPFSIKQIDGEVELVYRTGSLTKLRYLPGNRSVTEYAALWSGVLNPLMSCGDWFMKPFSFALSVGYLYCDKVSGQICYIYVPAIRDCSTEYDLKEMAAGISRIVSVTDAALENMVLRSIMKDFNPTRFLQLLRNHVTAEQSGTLPEFAPEIQYAPASIHPVQFPVPYSLSPDPASPAEDKRFREPDYAGRRETGSYDMLNAHNAPAADALVEDNNGQNVSYDIVIAYPNAGTIAKKANRKGEPEQRKNGKESECNRDPSAGAFRTIKDKDLPKSRDSCRDKNLYTSRGWDSEPGERDKERDRRDKERDRWDKERDRKRDRGKDQNKGNDKQQAGISRVLYDEPGMCNEHVHPLSQSHGITSGNTQIHAENTGGTHLRLVGNPTLPPCIDVSAMDGGVFTVGRFDASLGRRQSSFEFDKKTKAISRRHAAIERIADRYSIIDLSSSAGTFIDGQKLPPGTPFELSSGCRVSFGNAGADYIWEQ